MTIFYILLFVVLTLLIHNIETASRTSQQPKPIKTFFTKIVGTTAKRKDGTRGQDFICDCRVGEVLDILPEPDNKVDSNAIRIYRENGDQLGYFSADVAAAMMPCLCRGWTYRVSVGSISGGGLGRNRGINLKVDVLTMALPKKQREGGFQSRQNF
jgi:hypothetical protein